MSEKKRVFLLVLIMAAACMIVAGTTIAILYRAAFNEQREVLVATAQSQARLIESMSKFNAAFSRDYPGGPDRATLDQIIEAHKRYRGIGETGEFTLARREGDNIVFLLSHRYYDFDTPKPVPMDSKLAEPMRRALSGRSGVMVALDYRGEMVLAAHEPVAGPHLGIVAKVDLAELRAPFMKAGIAAVFLAIFVVVVGASLFLWITNPIVKRLREHSQHLAGMVQSLQQSEEQLQKARDNLEMRVQERTAELIAANDRLEVEVHERAKAEERLEALWNIAEMVDSKVEELCDHILQGTLQMTQSQYAFYGFMNSDESVMFIYAWSKEALEECRVLKQPIEYPVKRAGIWADAIRQRRVIVINDYQAEHPGKKGLPEGHIPLTRILVVPVFSRDRIVAIVAAANKPEDYTEEDAKQLEAFAGGVQVIIDQRRMEIELRESENKYSALVESSLTGIYIAVDGDVVFANSRFAEIHGYLRDEVIGMNSRIFLHHEERAFFDELVEKGLRGENLPLSYQVRGLRKNGEVIWTNRCNALIEFKGKPAIAGNVDDITQIKQMEEALLASEHECRLLSRQVMEAQEKERKRFAREIHDGIGQSLAAIKYRAEGISLMIEDRASAQSQELKSIVHMIQGSMEEVRRIQNDLRPAYLDDLGILAAMSYFCEQFQATYSDIRIKMQTEISELDISKTLKTPIFRIFQEAVNNAAKHSGASLIDVNIVKTEDRIELKIEDDGVGFDADHRLPANVHGSGLGLYSMRERAELSGGSLEIRSAPGKGTSIRATWGVADKIFA